MSQALRATILKRITCGAGESLGLDKLVARDPNDGISAAIFNGRKNQAPPVYDCLTYRLIGDNPDRRFRGPINSGQSGTISNVTLECEYWTLVEDSAPVELAKSRLFALLNNVSFPVPPFADNAGTNDAGGVVAMANNTIAMTDVWDDKTSSYSGLFRFHIRYQAN